MLKLDRGGVAEAVRTDEGTADYLERNKAAWDSWAPSHLIPARRAWQEDELSWGIWGISERDLRLIEALPSDADVIELGCGTAAISAGLARRGARPVAVDFSSRQLKTAEDLQRYHGVSFELLHANAEDVHYESASFDLALSEYGVSLWSDPRRWLPEANRLLRPDGLLVFFTSSSLLITCTSLDGSTSEQRLVRDYFGRFRVEFDSAGPVEFHLGHGLWIGLLREFGFVVERLQEVQPPASATSRVSVASLEWARRWPSEDVWVVRKVADVG